jgi:hypothetical protein
MIANKTGLAAKSFAVSASFSGSAAATVAQPIAAIATIAAQIKTEWCWAAVITSIVAARPSAPSAYVSQCDLAFDILRQGFENLSHAECCDKASPVGNQPIAAAWMNGEYDWAKSPLTLAGLALDPPQHVKGSIPSDVILKALSAGKAVCVGITWASGKSHFIAIIGARFVGTQQQFQIGDPTHGTVYWLSYADIQSYHTDDGKGTWDYTYVTV